MSYSTVLLGTQYVRSAVTYFEFQEGFALVDVVPDSRATAGAKSKLTTCTYRYCTGTVLYGCRGHLTSSECNFSTQCRHCLEKEIHRGPNFQDRVPGILVYLCLEVIPILQSSLLVKYLVSSLTGIRALSAVEYDLLFLVNKLANSFFSPRTLD